MGGMGREAEISLCGTWRYSLHRWWDPRNLECAWICLNPSTADGQTDDATVRKIIGFSSRLGYGGFWLFNLLAYRATDPQQLLWCQNPYGPENEACRVAERCKQVSPHPPIAAWGNVNKKFTNLALEFARALCLMRCFGFTRSGEPRHPLMLPYTAKLQVVDASHWLNRR